MARGKPRGAGPTRNEHLRLAKEVREKKAAKKKTTKKKAAKKKPVKKGVIPFSPGMLSVATKRESRPLSKTQKVKLDELKTQIEPALQEMVRSGRYMIAFWWLIGNRMPMRRITNDYPVGDFDNAVDTLDQNLREVKRELIKDEYEEDDG